MYRTILSDMLSLPPAKASGKVNDYCWPTKRNLDKIAKLPLFYLGPVMRDIDDTLETFDTKNYVERVREWIAEGVSFPYDNFLLEFPCGGVDWFVRVEHRESLLASQPDMDPQSTDVEFVIWDCVWRKENVYTINAYQLQAHKTGKAGIHESFCVAYRKGSRKLQLVEKPDPVANRRIRDSLLVCAGVVEAFAKLINARNVSVETRTPTPREMRDEARQGRKAPSPYRTLRVLRPTFLPAPTAEETLIDGEIADRKVRRHHVRGHFRHLRSERYKPETRGRYWIRAHWRGDESNGTDSRPILVTR
jgi:hypothetical protein